MPLGPDFATKFAKMIFWGSSAGAPGIPGIADVAAGLSTAAYTVLWGSLHIAAPTSDSQATSEAGYTNYARQSVARTSAGWAVTAATSQGSGVSVSPVATLSFPQATTGSSAETETYFSVGASSAGAGAIYWSGTISPNLVLGPSVTPRLTTGTVITLT
jgi:hypothetical protein